MAESLVKDPGIDTLTRVRRGASIGRYVVLGWVGSGAMGDVYSAYDPDLDRKLAIKLLRVKRGTSASGVDGKTRLLREAQAIAKLSHPNVVVVHDVGTFEDRVFIAMEFIEGGTLSFWRHAQPRSWREILKVFIDAGRGLQNAHEANLVHRDFKPDNVMVRVDGEVRVMDFGLVRYIDVIDNDPEPEPEPESKLASLPPHPHQPVRDAVALDATIDLARSAIANLPAPPAGAAAQTKLTQTGAILGTPAYMAPEQFIGQTADARTDQFSFCVALYEALYGVRPFAGSTMGELTGNVLGGHVKPPPAKRSGVPIGVWRALRRGLSVSPADRYPSMTELLKELSLHAHPRRGVLVASVAFALLAVLVGGLGWREIDRTSLCAVPEERFDGVWEVSGRNGSRRAAIEYKFRTTGQENARTTSTGRSSSWGWANNRSRVSFTSASHMLDKYVGDWLATYKDACEATNYRKDQSTQVLDLRMSCLNDRFNELRALSDSMVTPSSEMIENAGQAVATLGSLDQCSNVEVLRSPRGSSTTK